MLRHATDVAARVVGLIWSNKSQPAYQSHSEVNVACSSIRSFPSLEVILCLATQIVTFHRQPCKLGLALDEVDEVLSCLIMSEPCGISLKRQPLQLSE